jgi:hypothetical protein
MDSGNDFYRVPFPTGDVPRTVLEEQGWETRFVFVCPSVFPAIMEVGMVPDARDFWTDQFGFHNNNFRVPGVYTYTSIDDFEKHTQCWEVFGDGSAYFLAFQVLVNPTRSACDALGKCTGGVFFQEHVVITHIVMRRTTIANMVDNEAYICMSTDLAVIPSVVYYDRYTLNDEQIMLRQDRPGWKLAPKKAVVSV